MFLRECVTLGLLEILQGDGLVDAFDGVVEADLPGFDGVGQGEGDVAKLLCDLGECLHDGECCPLDLKPRVGLSRRALWQ